MKSLWTEKYRPSTPEELNAPPHIRRFLEYAMAHGHPHLLLHGPPGTGKTTFAGLLRPTMELNASDDRGIATIRGTVKRLASTVGRQVIVLDECENLTRDAQTCLRRVLEDYPSTTFIFCTNYYSKIIDPLKSRLLKFKFQPCGGGALSSIGAREGLTYDEQFYSELFRKCDGDLRRCINVLQGAKPLARGGSAGVVDGLIGIVPAALVQAFLETTAANYVKFKDSFVSDGYSVLQLVYQLHSRPAGTDRQKAQFALALSYLEDCCRAGCSDDIVLTNLCTRKIEIYS